MRRVRNLAIATGVVAGAVLLYGERHETRTDAEMEQVAHEERLDRYRAAEGAGQLLVMQYAQDARLGEDIIVGDMYGGWGWSSIVQGIWGQETKFPLGQTCLDDGEYDVENDDEGLNVVQIWDTPPQADWLDDNTIIVHPTPEGQFDQPLSFDVDANHVLSSANPATTHMLTVLGCSPEYVRPHINEYNPDSPLT